MLQLACWVVGFFALLIFGPYLFFVLLAALDPRVGAKRRYWRY